MKSFDNIPEQKPTLYSISADEFKTAPLVLDSYKPGDRITRSNFINFVINSFALSRGKAGIQILYFEWLKLKTGFDFQEALDNFLMAGGWGCLSDDERNKFLEQFGKVAEHNFSEDPSTLAKKGFDFLRNEISSVSSTGYVDRGKLEDYKLKDIATFPEFLKFVQKELNRKIADDPDDI